MSDLISRQAAIDEVKRLHGVAWGNWKETRISANTMIDALKDLPSAQPEPLKIDLSGYSKEDWERFRKEWANIPMTVLPEQRTGKWINGYCSECGEHAPFWAMASTYHESNFCPHCGAKMEVTI